MFRLLLATGVALVLITLLAPTTSQLFAAPPAAAPYRIPHASYARSVGAPPQQFLGTRAAPPQMYGALPAAIAAAGSAGALPAALEVAPTVLLAKSEADEFLEEVFINFPLAFVGLIFGYAALETAKGVLEVEFPEGSEGLVLAAACFGGAAFFVLLGNSGLLGGVAGVGAKALLDGWNVIASAVLKGAILKY